MGIYGTKLLIDQGYIGHLNLFAEPSDQVFFDHSTTSMTARIDIQGQGSTDDEPGLGHNATLLLGFLAQFLVRHMSQPVFDLGGKMTVAGLHTGVTHNRVFGSGSLLVNFAYRSLTAARRIEELLETTLCTGLQAFQHDFAGLTAAQKTVDDARQICALTWLKRGLPVLANRSPHLEAMLETVGLVRNGEHETSRVFTCDAMWAQQEEAYTIVFGPGALGANRAHAEGEFMTRCDLDAYAVAVSDIVKAFHQHVRFGEMAVSCAV